MQNTWLVILPAILVLIISVSTRNVIISLLIGIISACFIASDFSIIGTINLIIYRVIEQSNIKSLFISGQSSGHLFTFGFLICLGILISFITATGGAVAYGKIIEHKLKNKKNVQTMSLIVSSFLFLDDYLSSLITGYIIKPLTDKFKIPRAKLAYLLDALSAPLCVLIPLSSWIALILTEFRTSGINQIQDTGVIVLVDPFKVYLNSIIFMFYPILSVLDAFLIVRKRISFGLMHEHELKAEATGDLFNGKKPIDIKLDISMNNKDSSIWDFILPISSFLVLTLFFLFHLADWSISNILSVNPLIALFGSSFLTVIFSIFYFVIKKKILIKDLKNIIISGFNLMRNSLVVLLLAWTLGSILEQDLHTGQYIASILISAIPAFLLPFSIFVTSAIIAASTGSAWGTIAIMMPLSIPTAVEFTSSVIPATIEHAYLVYPVIGALISGAIAGGHISPISDSTVMAATSAGAYHVDHLITQLYYVIPAIIASSISLIVSGLLLKYFACGQILSGFISLIIGILISSSLLLFLSKNNKEIDI